MTSIPSFRLATDSCLNEFKQRLQMIVHDSCNRIISVYWNAMTNQAFVNHQIYVQCEQVVQDEQDYIIDNAQSITYRDVLRGIGILGLDSMHAQVTYLKGELDMDGFLTDLVSKDVVFQVECSYD